MITDLRRLFLKSLHEAEQAVANSIVDGGAASLEDYRFKVGQRRGLLRAKDIFEDAFEKFVRDDEQ